MAGYSARQSTYVTGDTIEAADSNDEFTVILAAFHATTGHKHDGTTSGDGAKLVVLGAVNSGSITSGFGTIDNGTSNITTGGILALDVDGGAAAAGALVLGVGSDASVFFDGTNLNILTDGAGASGIILDSEDDTFEFKGSGTLQITMDTDGIDLASGDAYYINNTSVLNATTLGSAVITSSLTAVGALNSGSITSGFTSIDVGAGAVTTTGAISGGTLTLTGQQFSSLTNTITAGSTQSQAGATALTKDVNRVTVSGTDGDGVKLPTAVAGSIITIINDDSAQTIKVWPNTDDAIDGGSANAVDANTLAFGSSREYFAVDATNWYTMMNSSLATPVSVASGGTGATSLTDGGVLLGSGTGAVTAMSVLADGNIIIGDGSTDPVALAAFSSSTGTLKVANGGTGASTLTDGGVLLGSGTNAVTAMGVLADSTMIVGDGSTDPVAESGSTLRTSIGVGTTDSPQFTNLTLTGFEYQSMTTGITAGTTQSQAGATALTTQTNRVTVSGTDADAVKLPTAVANALVTIINDDAAQTIAVWPNTGDTVDGGSANAVDGNTLAAGNSRTYLAYDATNWVTVTNAPTAAGLSADAITGIIETDGTYIDFVVFGPALDPVKDWDSRTSAATASLMLATIKDAGSNTTVQIWDLTDSAVVGGSAIASVTITGAATPTSIDAGMGYVVVGHEDGITVIDPHENAWSARFSLSTSSIPALTDNDVNAVAIGFASQPTFDPITGGPKPTILIGYGTGADIASILKDDWITLYDKSGTVGNPGVGLSATSTGYRPGFGRDGSVIVCENTSGEPVLVSNLPIGEITADDWDSSNWLKSNNEASGLGLDAGFVVKGQSLVGAGALGVTFARVDPSGANVHSRSISAFCNRTFTSGWIKGNIKGIWLANSKTVDRSFRANTLTENGTVPSAAVVTGSDITGYGPFTTSNYFSRAAEADFNLGTSDVTMIQWFNSGDTSGGTEFQFYLSKADNSTRIGFIHQTNGKMAAIAEGTGQAFPVSTTVLDDSVWHMAVIRKVGDAITELWIDGVLEATDTTPVGTLTDDMLLMIGVDGAGANHAAATKLTMCRVMTNAMTPGQIRYMYETEKRLFETNAKCLLQSGSTDAVLDVDIDPITDKSLVTQTDKQMTFNGLVMETSHTIASGGSTFEHGALYGGDRFEINNANLYATIAAKDLQQELETVRGLRSELSQPLDSSLTDIADITQVDGDGIMSDGTDYKAVPWRARNLIINGACKVAQRGTSQTDVPAGYSTVDRFDYETNDLGTSRYTQTQNTAAPIGFDTCIRMDCTTIDASITADEHHRIAQHIEARNLTHLDWGLATAKALTISFYVKSNLTGDFGLVLDAPDGTRTYGTKYTIDSSDTWEKKVILIPGDTGGTMDNNSGIGFSLWFVLACGDTRNAAGSGTADTWVADANNQRGGQHASAKNLASNTANDWSMTGLQVEVGSIDTPFEHLTFAQDLAACQRYYAKTFPYAVAPAQNAGVPGSLAASSTGTTAYKSIYMQWDFPVEMRGTPSLTYYNPAASNTSGRDVDNSVDEAISSDGSDGSSNIRLRNSTTLNDNARHIIHVAASAEI